MNTKYTTKTAKPRVENRGSINISANPISELKTAEVVIGINLQINKSIAKKLFFLFEERGDALNSELLMVRSMSEADNAISHTPDHEVTQRQTEQCESIQNEIGMYYELRNQVLTALIGEQE